MLTLSNTKLLFSQQVQQLIVNYRGENPSEFENRMNLFNAANNKNVDLNNIIELMQQYDVTALIAPNVTTVENIHSTNRKNCCITVEELHSKTNYKIFLIKYNNVEK